MSIFRSIPILAALLLVGVSAAQAGLCKLGRICGDSCSSECCDQSCCPNDYCCVAECETEKLKLHCWETETKPVAIPAVRLPNCGRCLKKLFRRGGCDAAGCADGCDSGCSSGGLMSRLCSKFTKCRVRCVSTYKKKEYECGTKCVCEWKAVKTGGCGTSSSCGTGCHDTSHKTTDQ